MRRLLRSALLATAVLVAHAGSAEAGGSAETTLIVANADSPISMRVAHAYRELRGIPAGHVLYLSDVPEEGVVDIDVFRARVLEPIESWLAESGLADDIDVIAYSTGFPYGVDFQGDLEASGFKPGRPISRTASLTGLTFLAPHVLAKDPEAYLGLMTNRYFRQPVGLPRPGETPAQRVSAAERRLIAAAQGALRGKDWRRGAETYEALVALNPEQPAYWYDLACCRALLGRKEEALQALTQAVETGFTRADHAEQDPDLEPLRNEPQFEELLRRMRDGAGSGQELGRVETLSRGFTHRQAWDENGNPVEEAEAGAEATRYRLAVMLGWAGEHGMSMEEILHCLRRGRQSDGTYPDGGFYLMANNDVRAKARMPFFGATVQALERLGFDAEVLTRGTAGQNGTLPVGRPRIAGLTAGTASFQWPKDMPDLLPGAIAEHLTSFGAHFGTASQTKCTEFLRHGAAGTSGTVAEPFAIFMKFPLPFVHVHYARGCSLAEAFYQSVWGPYQLLILGDPLARPYARFRDVSILAPDPGTTWSGPVAVRAATADEAQRAPAAYELWVDGRRVATSGPGEPLAWDTTTAPDGTHDVRVVALEAGPVATRSVTQAWVEVKNGDAAVTLEAEEAANLGELVRLEGRADGVDEIRIVQGSRVVASTLAKRGRFRIEVPTTDLGPGRVVLQAWGGEGRPAAVSAPVEIEIAPTALPTASASLDPANLLPGLRATVELADGTTREAVVTTTDARGRKTLAGDLADSLDGASNALRVRLAGLALFPEGLTEVALEAPAGSTFRVDDAPLLETTAEKRRDAEVLIVPGGWHRVELVAEGPTWKGLGLRVGGSRATGPLTGRELGHLPPALERASRPEAARSLKTEGEVFELNDGRRGGEGVLAWGEGVALEWARTERRLAAVVLYPARGKDAGPFPSAWIVETRASTHGAWKKVKKPIVLTAPAPEAPSKDTIHPPSFVEIRFAKTSARQLRVRPTDATQTPRLVEIEAYRAR